ncbi:MAG: FtsQ-type POTRA domain-containing protein [Cyanobacteria bacterium P01_A01_bin.45]
MTEFVSVSQTDLKERRKQLRRLRQMKIIQSIWQTLAVSSLAGGLLWVAVQPTWVLVAPKQIAIDGNEFFSDEGIRSQLKLSYPKSLWRIEPAQIEKSLLKQPFIAQAIVTRRLFPPRLIVQIQEREPVAIVSGKDTPQNYAQSLPNSNPSQSKAQQPGSSISLLDADGILIPLDKYTSVNPETKLPLLKIRGYKPKFRSQWVKIYKVLRRSSLKVKEIDFQDANNLILNTEIGTVHFGIPSSLFAMQVDVLLQMEQLPKKLNPTEIDYIDIKNPDKPLVQMNYQKNKSKQ